MSETGWQPVQTRLKPGLQTKASLWFGLQPAWRRRVVEIEPQAASSISKCPPRTARRAVPTNELALIRRRRPAECLLGRAPGFVGQHAQFRLPAAATFLAALLFKFVTCGIGPGFRAGFEFIEQPFSSQQTVLTLVAGGLRSDLDARGQMNQHDASRGLVYILPAVSRRTDKRLAQVGFPDAEPGHAFRQPIGRIGAG